MGRKNFYSYIEAKAAAQLLQINSCREYNLRYREDARLPAIPYRQYASSGWINWYDFLGAQERNFYASYEQAKFAVKALGISTSQEYIARYNEDSRLPATPYGIYAGIGWINWHDFLGKDQPKTLANFAEAKVIVRYKATQRSADLIALEGIQALSSQLVVTDGNRSLISSETPRSACVVFDWGICPMSASACNMGGEVLVDRSSEIIYGSVEAGYLGQRNCTRCRFFVTGVPFLGGLVALANEIALEINTESCRYQECTLRLDNLEREHYDACQGGLPFQRERERKLTVASQQQSAGKLDVMLADYASINNYVRCCLKLINDGESGSRDEIRLVVTGDVNDWGVSYQESNTSYHLLAEICQNAGVYKSANPSRALSLISEAIDRMAENNDLAPAMFRLSSEQKIVVANELNKLLLKRLGSWEKIDDLFSGDLMLLDVDANEPELSRVSTEICKLFSKPHLTSIISHEKNYE